MLTATTAAPVLGALLTGDALVNKIWVSIGVVVVFVAAILITVKFFMGTGKNIGAGIIAFIGLAIATFIVSAPSVLKTLGKDILAIFGISA